MNCWLREPGYATIQPAPGQASYLVPAKNLAMKLEDEDLPRRQRQRGQDVDPDGLDHSADPEAPADEVHLWLVAFQLGGFAEPANVY
jgi:hypothetical protein